MDAIRTADTTIGRMKGPSSAPTHIETDADGDIEGDRGGKVGWQPHGTLDLHIIFDSDKESPFTKSDVTVFNSPTGLAQTFPVRSDAIPGDYYYTAELGPGRRRLLGRDSGGRPKIIVSQAH